MRKIIGAPFDPSSRKTRADLIDYIQTLCMTDDSDDPLPPSLPPSLEPVFLPPESPPPPPPILSLPIDEFYDTSSEVSTSPDLADFDSPALNYIGPPPLFDPPAPAPANLSPKTFFFHVSQSNLTCFNDLFCNNRIGVILMLPCSICYISLSIR